MLLGQLIGAIGTGFLTTLSTSTPTLLWATFMVLAGWGTGMGENTPYIAIQAVMERYGFLHSLNSPFGSPIPSRIQPDNNCSRTLTFSTRREEDVFVGNGIATFVALLGGYAPHPSPVPPPSISKPH